MSHVVVFNSSAKSVKISTTPVKYLTEVRDEACQKFGVAKDQFTLKYNNKPIALSQQIRLANLAQGARLELVQASRSPTVISVALQLPASEKNVRLTQKLASNTSLWEILRQFESGQGANYNFTQRGVPEINGSSASGAGRLNYEMPVITLMPGHKEHSSFVELQKTLSQLGIDSGSVLLRLSFKNSGTPLEEAMAQISQYFKSADPAPSGAHTESSAQSSSIPDPDKAAPEATTIVAGETIWPEEADPSPMEVDEKPPTEVTSEPSISAADGTAQKAENTPPAPAPSSSSSAPATSTSPSTPSRNLQIFAASSSATPQAARQTFNPADYEPTIEHAKAHQAALNSQTRNTRLLSDKELEEQEKAKQEKVDAVAERGGNVRIRLPDGAQIQAHVYKTDTAVDIYDLVASCLERRNEPFVLQYRGKDGRFTKIERGTKRVFQDLRFSPSELITFSWDESASVDARLTKNVLSQECAKQAQILRVDEPVANQPSASSAANGSGKAEGKRKAELSSTDKENKIKNILKGGLFGKSKK